MVSERLQRQIDRLLDEADQAMGQRRWDLVRQHCQDVLDLDPDNADARAYLAAMERKQSSAGDLSPDPSAEQGGESKPATMPETKPLPALFANGRYQVKRFLGEGGKKKVYLAHDTLLDRDIAFALIKTEGLDDAGRQRLKREAQAMGKLGDHPHIVPVYDIGNEPPLPLGEGRGEGSQPYIVTQLMTGGDVEGLLDKAEGRRLPLEQALRLGDEVCRALEYAHGHGIVHRDLKPGNVWLTAPLSPLPLGEGPGDGVAKIGDFGLAVSLDRSRLTQQGTMVGTVSYMAPEQAMGGAPDPRSDLYSLGAMLYELITGRPPFIGDESVAIITQHLNVPPVSPTWHNPDCPPALEALILRLLEKDLARRPGSAREVREALGHISAAGVRPHPPSAASPRGRGDTSPRPLGEAPTSTSGAPLGSREGQGEGEAHAADASRALDSPLYRRTFVGREAELRQLQTAFDAALSGQGGLLMVVGEPGIGKTALCEQLATYVAVRGGKALVGHCYEEGSLSLPYLPFVEALRSYVLAREPDSLKQELGTGAADVARIVSEIRDRVPELGSVGARHASPEAGDPEDERWRLYQSVTGFLRNAAGVQPLLLVLEDLHWADSGTLDFLLHLSRNLAGARLVVVGTYRDIEVDRAHPLSAALAELRRGQSFGRVVLRGLTTEEVSRMLNALTGQEVRWSLAEAIHRQTEGNPLFIQEVLRYLVEEGLITHEGGRWRRAGDAPPELGIPEGLRDVIGKRLSRLGPECNQQLTLAAVIGRDFRLDVLQRVAGVTEEALFAPLQEALRVGVLEERSQVGATVSYRFTHAFFRQTLYEETIAPRRIRLHQQVARALEQVHARRLEEHAAELAEHFCHSSDPADLSKAVSYGELAAKRATSVYAYGEAVRLLEQALKVQEVLDPNDAAKHCDLLLALGTAQMPLGEPKQVADVTAEEAYTLAATLRDAEMDAKPDRERASRACRQALEALHRWGAANAPRTPEWRRWAERADGCAPLGSAYRAYADLALARVQMAVGAFEEGIVLCRQALELARHLDDNELFASAGWQFILQALGPAHWREAVTVGEEMAARPREGVSARTLGQMLEFGSLALFVKGERAGAEACWRELSELAQRSRDAFIQLNALSWQAFPAFLDGHLDEAVDAGRRLLAQGDELAMAGTSLVFLASRYGLAYRYTGLGAELVGAAERGAGFRGFVASWLAPALVELDRRPEAQQILAARTDTAVGQNDVAGFLETAILLGDRERAALLAQRLSAEAEAAWVISPARLLGQAAALLGEREQAMAYYRQALAVCEKIRFRPEIALTHLYLAELMLDEAAFPHPLGEAPLGSREGQGEGQPSAISPGSVGARHASPLQSRAEALSHLDFAIAEFRVMKMQPALERALRHKDLLKA